MISQCKTPYILIRSCPHSQTLLGYLTYRTQPFFSIYKSGMSWILSRGQRGCILNTLSKNSWIKIKATRKVFLLTYKLITMTDKDVKRTNMIRWEAELGQTFTLPEWLHAALSTSYLSCCINHKEIMCKIHLRWYMTPARFNHIKPDASRLCWRQCGALGTQLHMWWRCPVTSAFWLWVAHLLTEVLLQN